MRTSQSIKNTYTVTAGVLDYPATFPLYSTSDVAVYLSQDGGETDTLLTLGTDYTVAIANDGQSGTVTLAVGVATPGDVLALISNIPMTQELDLNNVSTINTEATETQLDRTVQMIQQVKEGLDRAVSVSTTESMTADQLRDTILLGKSEAEQLLQSQTAIDRLYLSVGNIDTVAGDITNIDTVAGSIANVDAVGGSIADVNSVASALTDVGAVASGMTDIVSVANDLTNIGGVAQDLTNIDTVAGGMTNVGTVASSIADVNTVASSIDDIEHMSLIISGVVPVVNGGTGVTTIDDIQAGKDGAGNTITSTYVSLTGSQTITGAKTYTGSAVFSSGATISGGATVTSGVTADTLTVSSGATISGGMTVDGKGLVYDSGDQTIGGAKTFTSGITIDTSSGYSIKSNNDASAIQIGGGSGGGYGTGAAIILSGKNRTGTEGYFNIYASDSTHHPMLEGRPDGTLTWDSKGFVFTSGDQNIAGAKTFITNTYIKKGTPVFYIQATDNNYSDIRFTDSSGAGVVTIRSYTNSHLTVGQDYNNKGVWSGAGFQLYKTGEFELHANANSTVRSLIGNPSGTLKWNGQTVQTSSDERIKTAFTNFPDAVLDAWGTVQWEQFKFKDAVKEKGEENCRWHAGLVAQHVQRTFEAQGQDALQYGILCHDEWEDEYIEDDGKQILRNKAGDLWTVRYTEALCMEAAYQRRRADRAEARISALEQRLAEMEQAIAALAGGAE